MILLDQGKIQFLNAADLGRGVLQFFLEMLDNIPETILGH